MFICGIFAVWMSGLGWSFAAQAARAIGCKGEAVVILDFVDVDETRSSTCSIGRAFECVHLSGVYSVIACFLTISLVLLNI
jgi:hypothetical protein